MTKKEYKVLYALGNGLRLRQRRFSDLYEIADKTQTVLFSVNRLVVDHLLSQGFIYSGCVEGYKRTEYLISDAGRLALTNPSSEQRRVAQ